MPLGKRTGVRIGFFTECYRPIVNGIVVALDTLANGLRRRGHEVFCFAPRAPGYHEREGPTFRIPSLPLPAKTAYRLTLPFVSRPSARRAVRELSLVHCHSPFITGWMGLTYARRYGLPLVFTYHTQLEHYVHYAPLRPAFATWVVGEVTRRYANAADLVIAPTESMRAHLRKLGVRARIEVVPSAVDVELFGRGRRRSDLRSEMGAGEEQPLLLLVSRLAKEKNLALVFDALKATGRSDVRLAVAGDGPHAASLRTYADGLGLGEQVRFIGVRGHDELPDLYASADAFVFASTSETQGLVLAEAMAAGAQIIAVDTPQTRDVVGSAAVLVPDDAAQLARALGAVTLRDGPSPVAKAAALRFGVERQAAAVAGFYGELTAAR